MGRSKKFSNNKKHRTPPKMNAQSTPRQRPRRQMQPVTPPSSPSPAYSTKDLTTFYLVVPRVLQSLIPTVEDVALRVSLINKLKEWILIIEGEIKGCVFEPYGSYSTGLFTRFGDVDLCVLHKDKNILYKLYWEMYRYLGPFSCIEYIDKKHPLLKFVVMGSDGTGLPFDLTYPDKDNSGKMTSLLMKEIKNIDERFEKLVLLVKGWAVCHEINDASKGGLKSYVLYVMVIHHLQTTQPPILPPLKKICTPRVMQKLRAGDVGWQEIFHENVKSCGRSKNEQDVPELFFRFINKFRRIRRAAKDGYLSVKQGQWVPKTDSMQEKRLWVEEPFKDEPENLARSIKKDDLSRIGRIFKKTHRVIIKGQLDDIIKNLVSADLIEEVTISSNTKPTDDDESWKPKASYSPVPLHYEDKAASIPSSSSSMSRVSVLVPPNGDPLVDPLRLGYSSSDPDDD